MILGVINVLQPVLIEVFKGMDVFREQAHGRFLLALAKNRERHRNNSTERPEFHADAQ